MLIIILKALVIGFFASVGLGPVTILVLQRGFAGNFKIAFVSGLGSAVVDSFYGTLAFLGAAYVLGLLDHYEGYFRIGIMAILFVIAIVLWKSKSSKNIVADKPSGRTTLGNIAGTFTLALSNPFLILVFLTIFALIPVAESNDSRVLWPWVSIGLLLGTTLWWFVLSYTVGLFRRRLPKFLSENLNRIAAVLLFLLGLFSGISGILILVD